MKNTLISTVLLLSFGIAHAGSGWESEQGKGSANQSGNELQSVQATAVQPGIGDRADQFDDATRRDYDFSLGDWTDLRNEEIYGSF